MMPDQVTCPHVTPCACSRHQTQLKQLAHFENQTIKYNRVFQRIEYIQLDPAILEVLTILSTNWEGNWLFGIEQLCKLNRLLLSYIPETNDFERTAILSFDQACGQFIQLLDASFPTMALSSFKKLFYQHWTRAHLAYLGSPTDGLQITG